MVFKSTKHSAHEINRQTIKMMKKMIRNQKPMQASSLAKCQNGLRMSLQESKMKNHNNNQMRIKKCRTKINK